MDSEWPWPIPFSGIKYVFTYNNKLDFNVAIDSLLMCESNGVKHRHNFGVQTDGLTLHVSDIAFACLERTGNIPRSYEVK